MLDNRWKLDGLLTGDKSEVVKAGLEACLPEVAPDEPAQTLSQRYADALVELARRALQNVPTTGRPSADVTLLLTFQDYVSGGIARYGCAYPGCNTKAQWCQAHHVKEYDRDSGPTDIDNMALLCSRHHHLVHSVGWSACMLENQTLEVCDPHGRRINAPPPTKLLQPVLA